VRYRAGSMPGKKHRTDNKEDFLRTVFPAVMASKFSGVSSTVAADAPLAKMAASSKFKDVFMIT